MRGHSVRGLVRPGSTGRLPAGAVEVFGNALDAASFTASIPPADTLVHLVGTPHPSPLKARQFREVDLVSVRAAVSAVAHSTVRHFIYLSVAHPSPGDAGVHRGANREGGVGVSQRLGGGDSTALVCAGAGLQVAISVSSCLPGYGGVAGGTGTSAPPGTGDAGSDGGRAGAGGRKPYAGHKDRRGTGDSRLSVNHLKRHRPLGTPKCITCPSSSPAN